MITLIVLLQVVYFFVDFSSDKKVKENTKELLFFQNKIDSLKAIEVERIKFKTYKFNPNYISDFKGEQLGMSLDEINRLHAYRKQGRFVNSVNEFQQVTQMSDSLINKISSNFKFPDWVVQKEKRRVKLRSIKASYKEEAVDKKQFKVKITPININTATFKEVLKIPYIDYALCKSIFDYRDEVAELQDISEIKNIAGFPIDKYDRIVLYLKAE
ncbi:ComEA family DNA-binding protein [Tenacibaculum soleae]|uniref:ComEA family DNA-binding protein n=1 Tax=Tenacibaculum soleae TaxID=447689 RepID=UPI0023016984|nr:helix-hairpin-helix domain-containing protein [Tenacibaculum soleae]